MCWRTAASRCRAAARRSWSTTACGRLIWGCSSLQRRADGYAELADPLDFALDLVASDGGGDARRRAGDLERDLAHARMAALACRLERPARRGMVERLADFPRPLDLA